MAETAAARWLTDELGIPITRAPLAGNADKGDLLGIDWLCIEIKNTKLPHIKGWGRELAAERRNSGKPEGVVLWSPPGVGMRNVDQWIALDYDCDDETPRVVPHIGPLNKLHHYVAVMDGWRYVVDVPGRCYATRASTWLIGVRDELVRRGAG